MYNFSCNSLANSTLDTSAYNWTSQYPQELQYPYIPDNRTPFQPVTLAFGEESTKSDNFRVTRKRAAAAATKKMGPIKKLRKSENQIEVLKKHFKRSPKPGRESIEQLADATGLQFLEVRNWFRNARLRNKDNLNLSDLAEAENESCEVSSSTGNMHHALDKSSEIMMLWQMLDNEERIDLFPKFLLSWNKDSAERTDAMKAVIKCLSTTEKNFVHGAVKPRGPYRCSSDTSLSKTTILERAKNAWKELERMFGANKREKTTSSDGPNQDAMSLNLDRDMLEGLKSLFQGHRDYLYYLFKEMGIVTNDERDVKKFKSPQSVTSLQRCGLPEESPFIPHPQYLGGGVDTIETYHSAPPSCYQAYPAQILPAAPTPIYPPAPDFMTYPYNYSTYNNSPLQLGDCMSGARSSWIPPSSSAVVNSLTVAKSPYFADAPDYSFVKNHFTPDKLSVPQPERASLKRPFSEVGGGMSFYNAGAGANPRENTSEITQKCTFVKYYEVTYNNKSCPGSLPPSCSKAPLPVTSDCEQLH